MESPRLFALHIENTHHFSANDQRKCHFGARFGQVGVIEEHGIFADIERDARSAGQGCVANDAAGAERQPVTGLQHSLPARAVGGAQHSHARAFIQQEDAHMVIPESFADHVGNQRQQPVQMLFANDDARYVGNRLQLPGALFALPGSGLQFCCSFVDSLLQPRQGLVELHGHLVEDAGQLPHFVFGMDLGARRKVARSNAAGNARQIADGAGDEPAR